MKRIHWYEAALVIAVLGIHLYAALTEAHNFPRNWFNRDDAYFYFKVARNLSAGLGSTFDGLTQTNGYHPLWMLACIPIFALARFDLILPLRVLLMVMAGLSAASGVLVFRLLKRTLSEPVAMLAAAYWVFNSFIHASVTQYGLETGLLAFAILLLLRRLQAFEQTWRAGPVRLKEIILLALLAVFVLLSRLDMVFLAGLVGIWVILRGTPLRFYLLSDLLVSLTAMLVGFVLRSGLPDYYFYAPSAIVLSMLVLAIRIPLLYALGLDRKPGSLGAWQVLARTALAVGVSSGLGVLFLLTFGGPLNAFPRAAVLAEAGLSFVLLSGVRLGAMWFKPAGSGGPLKLDWRRILREGLVFYGLLGAVLAAYMLYNLAVFGTSMPVSGQVKRWWGAPENHVRGGPARSLEAFLGLDSQSDFNVWPQVAGPLEWSARWLRVQTGRVIPFEVIYPLLLVAVGGIAFIILSINRQRCLRLVQRLGLLPLFAGGGLQLLSYNATGYSAVKEWYWVCQMLFLVLFAAVLVDQIIQRVQWTASSRRLLLTGAALLALVWCVQFGQHVYGTMPPGTTHAGEPYVEAQAFIESQTPPGAMVAMTGGGNMAYFVQDRSVVNMDGLINSYAYFEAMREGKAADYLYNLGVDYIFANPDLLTKTAPFQVQFKGRLQKLNQVFGGKELMRLRPPVE